MSAVGEPEYEQEKFERSNGSVLCRRQLIYGKCSAPDCPWKHEVGPDDIRPLCRDHFLRKNYCSRMEDCPLIHISSGVQLPSSTLEEAQVAESGGVSLTNQTDLPQAERPVDYNAPIRHAIGSIITASRSDNGPTASSIFNSPSGGSFYNEQANYDNEPRGRSAPAINHIHPPRDNSISHIPESNRSSYSPNLNRHASYQGSEVSHPSVHQNDVIHEQRVMNYDQTPPPPPPRPPPPPSMRAPSFYPHGQNRHNNKQYYPFHGNDNGFQEYSNMGIYQDQFHTSHDPLPHVNNTGGGQQSFGSIGQSNIKSGPIGNSFPVSASQTDPTPPNRNTPKTAVNIQHVMVQVMRNIGGIIPAPRDVVLQRKMQRGLSHTPSGPNGQWPNQEAAGNLRTLQSQGSLAGRAAIHQPFGGNQHRIATGPRNNFRQGDSSYHYPGSVDRSENGPTNTRGYTHGNNRGYANGNNGGYTNGNNGGYTSGNNGGNDGGYTSGNNGGYTNGNNGGYTNGRNGGYTNGRNGGCTNGNNGGYINGNNGGYTDGNNGGYTDDNNGRYTDDNNGGYTNGNNGGYTNGNNGGYTTNGNNGGYTDDNNGGYTNGRDGGYTNGRNGGYTNGRNGGYTSRSYKGYTSDRGTIARQQLAAPSAKFPGSVRTDSSAHGSVGSPVGRDLQSGYSTPINKSIHSPSPASGVHNLRQGRPFQAGSESLGYPLSGDDNRPSDNIARTSRQDHSWTPGLDKRGETDYQSTANGNTTVTLANHTPPNRRVENNYAPIDQPQHAEKRALEGPPHIPALKCRDVGNYNSGSYNSGLGSGLHANRSLIYAICPPKSDPDDHQPGILHYTDSGSESPGRYTPEPAQPADLHIRYSPKPDVDRSALRLFYDHGREAKKESNPDPWLEFLPGKNESTEKKATKWSHAASTDAVFDDVKASLPESITDKERTRSEDPILAAPNLQKPDQFTKGNRGVAEEKPGDRGFNPVPPSLPAPAPPTPSLPAPAPPTPSLPALAPPTPPEPPEPPASPAPPTPSITLIPTAPEPSLPASAPPTPPTPSATRPALSTHPRPGSGLPPPATLLSIWPVTGTLPKPNLKPKNRNTKEKVSASPTVPGVPGVPGSVSDPIRAPAPVRVSTSVRIPDNAHISPPKWVENAKVTPSPYPRVAKENPKGGPSTTPQTKTCWLCGGNHDAPCEANVLESSKTRRNQVNGNDNGTWDYQGINKPWSEDEVIEKQEARKTGKKSKCRIRKAHAARDLPDQDDNGGVLLGKFMGTEAAQPTKLVPKKREKRKTTRGGVVLNGGVERAESAPEELLEAPKFDGPKSVMARADRSHIGRYSDGAVTGIRRLSEDNLTTIFSYLADGLMPEDQMETKNVHIGNSFKFDTSFTTTRYRRLRAVLRSCHYWRHLGQQIVCKYVNLNKLPSFELFVRTISEDEELGNMVRAIKVNIHGGASYMAHDRQASKQLAEMPKVGDLAQLFIRMMHSCPQLQVLSVNMHGAIMGFNLVIERFPMMREIQIKDDRSKGIVARNIWINLARNYPNLENFRIFHCQENAATNFDNLKFSPKFFQLKGGNEIILKALTMERCPEISDKGLAALCPKLKNLTTLVIVDCKLVTSGGLARAIEKLPDPSRITRLIYFVWVDPFGNSTADEMSYTRSHLCSTIRKCCTNVSYLCWKPYRICGDFWKDSNFHSLERCRIEPMSFRDCDEDVNDHSKFTEAYQQARDQERLPKLKEDRVFFDFYF